MPRPKQPTPKRQSELMQRTRSADSAAKQIRISDKLPPKALSDSIKKIESKGDSLRSEKQKQRQSGDNSSKHAWSTSDSVYTNQVRKEKLQDAHKSSSARNTAAKLATKADNTRVKRGK